MSEKLTVLVEVGCTLDILTMQLQNGDKIGSAPVVVHHNNEKNIDTYEGCIAWFVRRKVACLIIEMGKLQDEVEKLRKQLATAQTVAPVEEDNAGCYWEEVKKIVASVHDEIKSEHLRSRSQAQEFTAETVAVNKYVSEPDLIKQCLQTTKSTHGRLSTTPDTKFAYATMLDDCLAGVIDLECYDDLEKHEP
jgi:hypothetical protein